MTLHAKLERLTKFSNLTAISRDAGLSDSTLAAILHRKRPITTATASALAKTLGVDVGWLVNDEAEWPPVHRPGSNSKSVVAA